MADGRLPRAGAARCLSGPGCGLCFTRRRWRPLSPRRWKELLGPPGPELIRDARPAAG